MNATLRFRRGHALHPVHAALVTQFSKNRFARNAEDRFLKPAELRWTRFQVLGLQPGGFRVALVHAIKIGRENGSSTPACSGTNFYAGIALCIVIRRRT